MHTVDIHEAEIHFSKLIGHVLQGEEVLIAIDGKLVAKLGPIRKTVPRRFGVLNGKVKIAKDFEGNDAKKKKARQTRS